MSTPSLIHSVQSPAEDVQLSRHERDAAMVRRARSGDHDALEGLWDEYRRPVHHYFARSIVSREEVEDLTSETMLAVFHNISTFRGIPLQADDSNNPSDVGTMADGLHGENSTGCTFHSFVYSIAKNQLRQWLRRKHVRDQRTPAVSHQPQLIDGYEIDNVEWRAADASADPLFAVLRQEHLDSACYALAGVGIRSCERFKALLFHYACGLPHKDVAVLLGTRKETINTRLQEGRVMLKAHYNPDETS